MSLMGSLEAAVSLGDEWDIELPKGPRRGGERRPGKGGRKQEMC